MKGDLPGALAAYRASLASAEKGLERSPDSPLDRCELGESWVRMGDVQCMLGDLDAALQSYGRGLADFSVLDPADPKLDDGIRDRVRRWLVETRVRIGDVERARGAAAAARSSHRGAVAASLGCTPEAWEKAMTNPDDLGGRLAGDWDPEELDHLTRERIDISGPDAFDRLQRITSLILRAGAERNPRFRYLLAGEDLRKNEALGYALAGYDYSLNGNAKALDFLLARLAAEPVGSDSSVVVALAHVDEWDRTVKAVEAHFTATDGAGGDCQDFFWLARRWYFPRSCLQFKGMAGDGAPVGKDRVPEPASAQPGQGKESEAPVVSPASGAADGAGAVTETHDPAVAAANHDEWHWHSWPIPRTHEDWGRGLWGISSADGLIGAG